MGQNSKRIQDISQRPIVRHQQRNTVYQKRENDVNFLQDLQQLAKKSTMLINPFDAGLLSEQVITQIAEKAEIHQKAMIPSLPEQLTQQELNRNLCKCGCRRAAGKPIPLCQSIDDMKFLGSAVTLYFFFIKMCIFLTVFGTMFYSLYSFLTNIFGEDATEQFGLCQGSIFCEFKVGTSLKRKMSWSGYILIQYWLSLGFCLGLIFMTWATKHIGNKINQNISNANDTPADRAVKIQNLPYRNNTQLQIIQRFKNVWLNKKRQKPNQQIRDIQIKSIHIVYNMKSIRQLTLSIREQAIKISQTSVVKSGGSIKDDQKQKRYMEMKEKFIKDLKQLEDALKRFNNQESYRRNLSTTCAILEFYNIKDKEKFLETFGVDNSSRLKRMAVALNCLPQKTIMYNGKALTIAQASQPEDIYWENCQNQYNIFVSFGIWLAAAIIILITLGVLIGIQYGQEQLLKNYPNMSQNIFSVINYCKTIILVVINKCIWISLSLLLKHQRNHSLSDQMISLISTSAFAQTVNSIGLTFIVQLITKRNYYGAEGVIGVAFDFAVSNSIIMNVVSFFDFQYIIKKVLIFIKCLRNWIIKISCRGLDPESLDYQIPDVNKLYEGGDFNMTESYTTIIIALFHMSFFATMQPFIVLIVCLGLVPHFFLKRYLLVRRYNYPKLLDIRVFHHMILSLKYIPIFHGFGMMVTVAITFDVVQKWYLFVPSGICVLVGFINLINPCDVFDNLTGWISRTCFSPKKKTRMPQELYEDNRHGYTVKGVKMSKYIQYFQTNNLATLLGYKSILSHGVPSQKNRQQLNKFVQSFNTRSQSDYNYPRFEEKNHKNHHKQMQAPKEKQQELSLPQLSNIQLNQYSRKQEKVDEN